MLASQLCMCDKTDSKSKWVKGLIVCFCCPNKLFWCGFFDASKIPLFNALFQFNKQCIQWEGITP